MSGAVGARNWGACPLICDWGFVDRSGKCPLILGPTFDTVAAESRLLRAGSPRARQQLRSARPPCRPPACGTVLPSMARWSPRGRSCLAPLTAVRACRFPSCCVCTFPARSLCEAKSSEKPRAGPPGGCVTLQPQPAAWEQQGEGGLAGRAGLGAAGRGPWPCSPHPRSRLLLPSQHRECGSGARPHLPRSSSPTGRR